MVRRRGAASLVAVTMLTGGLVVAAAPASAEQDERPTAAVSLGDSAASGEGARNYEPETDEVGINQCHRSQDSYIHRTGISGIDATINLACSGAESENLYIEGEQRWNEPSQADQLAEVAGEHDVRLVTVQVGANDDPGFADTVLECVVRWAVAFGPGCRDTIGAEWPDRVEAMKPQAAKAVSDVRQVMADAGYAADDYDLVVMSYASPVTEDMRRLTHGFEGCPLRIADAEWGRTVATHLLTDALRDVAADAGARFLDLSRATEGHEACNKHVRKSQQWVRALTVRAEDVLYGVGGHLVQESFHPNARGHEQIGRCLGEFYTGGGADAACRIGGDGNLRPSG
ncbi:MAG: GDSL-type esterase/lipase family protein [Actinomycetota bacterium]